MHFHLCLAVAFLALPAWAQSVRPLSEFGDLSAEPAAREALKAALDELLRSGGGVLVIPEQAREALHVEDLSQAERETSDEGPAVTIIDQRAGSLAYHVAPIGKHQDGTWAGFRVERVLNLGDRSLPHCGWHTAQATDNYVISGCTSYMTTLTDAAAKGADRRL